MLPWKAGPYQELTCHRHYLPAASNQDNIAKVVAISSSRYAFCSFEAIHIASEQLELASRGTVEELLNFAIGAVHAFVRQDAQEIYQIPDSVLQAANIL